MNTRRWRLPMLAAFLLSLMFWGWPFLASPGKASTAQVCPPVASTQYFTFVYGAVTLNGAAAPVGAIVEARSPRGETVGCVVIETAGLYPLMYIYGEETIGGQTTPGMRTGETVSFFVNSIAATANPTFGWVNSWQSTRVDLTATGNNPPPVADFTASLTSGTAPLTVQFTDASTGTITSRSWSFGDGGTSTAQNPSYSYAAAGVYTVTLTVTGPGGSDTETKTSYITVNHPPPVADFTASPTSGTAPLAVQFTDASTGTITSRSWSFGDGGTSTAQNPSHSYETPGVYTVTLTVTGPGGSDTETKTSYITVNHPPPVADFTASPTSGTAPLAVQFTDASTGTITSRSWSFGDGGTSTAQNPSYTFTTPGVYTVTLTVTGPGGSDTRIRASYITVTETQFDAPVADFAASPTSGTAPLAVQFADASTGTITSRSWDFGDGGTSTAQNPSYSYSTPGVYTVTLTVTGPGGSDTKTRVSYITVTETQPDAPVANFTADPTSGTAPLTVQFTDASTGTVSSHSWNFGDGGTSTALNPSHSYAAAGVYTVTLTVTGPGGSDTDTKTSHITVSHPPPVADFTGSPTSGVAPLAVQFTDVSTGTITSRSWSFGDGGTNTAQNPSYSYETPGVYTVTLTVTGPGGSDTETKTSYITVNHPPPVADFSASPTSGVALLAVQFTDVSTGTITSRSWSFGDGGTSTAQNPSYSYAAAGVYTVTLTVTGPGGSDTETKTSYITVNHPPPVADFTATPTSGVAPLAVQFTDASTGTITSRSWSFGDGGTSTAQNPSYSYTAAGIYTVTLTVGGPGGADNTAQPVRVAPPPPIFIPEPAPADGLTVHFTFDPQPGVTHWLWEFGDGETSTAQNPVHTYAAPGDYVVRLTVYTADGLSSTQERAVQVQAGSSQAEFSLYLPSVAR